MQTILTLYLVSNLFLMLISLPLIARKIGPNPFYGFRVRQTLEDPNVWYETNQYFAKRLFFVGFFDALASLGFYFIPNISLDIYALSCLGVFVILFAVAMAQSWRYMRSLNR